MKLAHRYDWHHAPEIGPFEDGKYQRWCKWCGFRESFRKQLYGMDVYLNRHMPKDSFAIVKKESDAK